MTEKLVPQASPETEPFWEGCAESELRLQFCESCQELYFPPRPFCPNCLSSDVIWRRVSGLGTLHTYVINYVPAPGFESNTPYAIAVVQLAEGPRLMSNIVGIENTPEALELDMELRVDFEQRDAMFVPVFRPA